MIENYLRTTLRSLLRNRTYSLIHMAGLSLGMAAFILVSVYVHFEKSFDQAIPGGSNIFRVESRFYKGTQLTNRWATSTNGYALALKDNFPDIQSYTRINWHNSERVVRYENLKFRESHVCFADTNFLSFFSIPLLEGDKATALRDVNTVVISASAARKYFGRVNPLGKFLDISTIETQYHCLITGIFADLSPNTTLQFNFLISWATSPEWMKTTWYLHESYTFLQLFPGTDVRALEARFPALAEKYKNGPALKELTWAIQLIPLRDIHLNPGEQYETETKGNRTAMQFLNVVAFFILLIACVNYVNLSTARAMERAKEVGIRKVSGAHPLQLAGQFLLESFVLNLGALLLAAIGVGLAGPALMGYLENGVSFYGMFDAASYGRMAVVFFVSVLLSGVYPALVLSRMQPVAILKGRFSLSRSGLWLRKGLVTFQFAISLLLIAGTLAVYRQITYMNQQALGVDIKQTLVLKAPVNTPGYGQKAAALKVGLLAIPGVTGVSGSGSVPGSEVGEFLANRRVGASREEERTYEMLKVDADYIPFYGLQIIAGRSFDKGRPADSTGLVLNESAVRQFGFLSATDAIGQKIWLEVNHGKPNEVIGVIRDYHQQSLQQDFTPVILFMDPAYGWIPTNDYSVRIHTSDMGMTLTKIRDIWQHLFPESSLDSFFLDEYYNRQYRQEKQFGWLFGLFSSLAIVIACMGLFGLTAYTVSRRTMEIGVRKVLGASVGHLLRLLTWDSAQLILPAGLLAVPLSYWLIGQWLHDYAFRAPLTWWQFALPIFVLLFITLMTTGYLAFRAALTEPSRTLRES